MTMKQIKLSIKKVVKGCALILLSQALISCGTNEESEEQVQQQKPEQVELDVSQSNVTIGAPVKKVAGQTIGNNQVVQAGLLNSTGSIEYPKANTLFSGNITTSVQVADPDGINRVFVTFAETDFQLTICSENCGNEFAAFVNGINPLQFGLSSGQQTFEVWVEDNLNNIDLVDSVAINWQSLVISGVSIEFLQEEQQINVSWQPLDGMLRYNLYIANDPSLNGKNVETLAGGEARLALTETSANFTEKAFAEDYFILVTGVDGSGESAFSDVISLLNGEQNLPPVANNDSFTVNEDEQLEANVLANDEARDSIISLVTTPVRNVTNGSLVLAANGDFQYQPNENFFGTDEFVYQIQNAGGLTAEATVSITINSINDAPVAQDDAYAFDLSLGSFSQEAPGVLGNDSDIDSDTLTVSSELVEPPILGAVTLNEDGSFNYVANDASIELLEDSFVYQILDSEGLTANATVSIRGELDVNHPPVAVNDEFSVNEDEMLTVTVDESILNNDTDEDHDNAELTVSLVSSTTNGELVLASDGSFDYSPAPNFNGQDSFTYQISDPDQQSATASVTINVTPINDAPTAVDNTYILTVDNTFTISNEKGVLNNDGDVENDEIKVDVTTLTFPSGTLEMSELGGFTYTPPNGFIGTDSFTYKVTDGNLLSAEATVQFSVTDRQFITDNQTSIIIADSSNDPVQVVFTADMISAEHGSFEISDDGLIVTYIPNPDFVGMDLITIEVVVDGVTTSVQYYIYVEAVVNLPPEFSSSNSASVAENVSSGSLIYTAVAVDPEGGLVTYALTGQANAAGVPNSELQAAAIEVELPFEIDPQTGQLSLSQGAQLDFETTPSYSLSIVASDNAGNQSTLALSLSVININEAPIASDDSVIVPRYMATVIDVLANDTDPENDSLSIVASSLNANSGAVAVLSDQTLSYLPNDDATVDVISYQVQDAGGLQSQATVAVTIADAPATGPHDINADGVNDLTIVKSDDLQEWQLTFDSSVSLVSEVDANRLYPLEKSVSGIFEPKVAFSEQTKSYEVVISGKKHQIDLMDLASDAVINLERSGSLLAKDFSGITLPASFIYIEPGYNTDNFSKFNRASVNAGSNAGATLTFNADNTGVYTDDEGRQTFNWSIDGSVITAVKDSPISETVTITPDELLALGVIDSATHTNYLNNYGYGDDLLEIPVEEPSITLEITDNVNVYLQLNEVTRLLYQLPAELGGTQSQIDSEAVAVRAYQLELLSLVDFDPLANNGQWALPISNITGEFESRILAKGAQFDSATTGYFYDFLDDASTTAFTWSITGQALTIETTDFTHVYQVFGQYSNAWYVLLNAYDKNNVEHYSATTFVIPKLSEELTPVSELMTSGVIVNLFTTTDPSNYDSNGNFAIDNLFAHELTTTAEPRAESGVNKSYQYYSSGGEAYLTENYWKLDVNHFLINSYVNSADGSFEVCDESADANCVVLQQRDLEVLNFDSERGLVWVIESRQRLNYASIPFDPESTPLTTLVKPRITAYSVLPSQDLVEDTATIDEDSNDLTIDVLANDYANTGLVDGLTLLGATTDYGSVSVVNGQLVYTPEFNFNGTVTIQYLVLGPDGQISTQTVTITVNAVNDKPESPDLNVTLLEGNSVVIDLLANVTDPEADSVNVNASSVPVSTSNGSIVNNNDGTITYTHDGTETTSDSFTYQVSDGQDSSEPITVFLTITPVNDAPVVTSSSTLNLNENEPTTGTVYTATSSDAEGNAITYTLSDANSIFTLSQAGALVISDHSQLDFETFTSYDLTITASDGTDSSAPHLVTVTLNDVVENTELTVDTNFGVNKIAFYNPYSDAHLDEHLIDAKKDRFDNTYVLLLVKKGADEEFVVAKYDTNWQLVSGFGYNGIKRIYHYEQNDDSVSSFAASPDALSAKGLLIHDKSGSSHDGKVYVYGAETDNSIVTPFVVRLEADGSIDSAFATSGKYDNSTLTGVSAVDLLLHSAGGLYLASNTQASGSANFYLEKLDEDTGASLGAAGTYDFSFGYDTFASNILENSSGEIVAIGDIDSSGDSDIFAARISADTSEIANSNSIASQNFDVMAVSISDGPSQDYADNAVKIDASTAMILGATNYKEGTQNNLNTLLMKIDLDSLTLFGGNYEACSVNGNCFGTEDANNDTKPDGVTIIEVSPTVDDKAISGALSSAGEVTFISRYDDGNRTYLIPYQIDSVGLLTSASTNLSAEELTKYSGDADDGTLNNNVANTDISAVPLYDPSGSSTALQIVSSKAVDNTSRFELQTFIVEYAATGSSDLNGDSSLLDNTALWDHTEQDFTSFKAILDNDSNNILGFSGTNYTNEIFAAQLTRFDISQGEKDFTFNSNEGLVNWPLDEPNGVGFETGDVVVLNDGTIVTALLNGASGAIDIYRRNADGSVYAGADLPSGVMSVDKSSSFTTLTKIVYDGTKNYLYILGQDSEFTQYDQALVIVIDTAAWSVLANVNIDVLNRSSHSIINDAVLLSDSSLIVVGKALAASGYHDGFAVKLSMDDDGNQTDNLLGISGTTGLLEINDAFDADNADNDRAITLNVSNDVSDTDFTLVESVSDNSIIIGAKSSNLTSLLKYKPDENLQYSVDTTFNDEYEAEQNSSYVLGNWFPDLRPLSEDGQSGSGQISDIKVVNDELWLVGQATFATKTLGFVGKFDALTGNADDTFGNNTLSGFYVPFGREDCDSISNNTYSDFCNIKNYKHIDISDSGELIISGEFGHGGNNVDGFMIKFTETQNDTAVSYKILGVSEGA